MIKVSDLRTTTPHHDETEICQYCDYLPSEGSECFCPNCIDPTRVATDYEEQCYLHQQAPPHSPLDSTSYESCGVPGCTK